MLDQTGTTSGIEESLRSFGLTANEARAYLTLLRAGRLTPGELAPKARLSRGRVYQVLAELERKGFVAQMPGRVRAYRAVEPPAALGTILEAETARAERLRKLAEEFTPRLIELQETQAGGALHPAVEVLARPEQIGPRFRQLEDQARREVLMFTKPPLVHHDNIEELEGLRRGVRHASLYERTLLQGDVFLSQLAEWVREGEEARVVDRLPTKMAVFDRELALLPLAAVEDPASPFTLVVVHDAGLAETLALGFDLLWEQAEPITPNDLKASADAESA